MRVLVAQGVGQGEGVVLAAGHPVALACAGGDARIDRKHAVPAGLQPLNQQLFGAFHADREAGAQLGEFGVELGEACPVVVEADLPLPLSGQGRCKVGQRALELGVRGAGTGRVVI